MQYNRPLLSPQLSTQRLPALPTQPLFIDTDTTQPTHQH